MTKKQVVVIHGGDIWGTYDEYVAFLINKVVDSLQYFLKTSWHDSLQYELGSEYQVIRPEMPNKRNAKYEEWKIWFEKLIPFLDDDVILVGHSLGAVFISKYLSENKFSKKIKGIFLVAPPFDSDMGKKMPEFSIENSLELLASQVNNINFYYSEDDTVVEIAESEKFVNLLPNARITIFKDRGHFNQDSFPELVADIKAL